MRPSLRSLIREVADADFSDPAWWAVLGLAGLIERIPSRGHAPYLSSDAQPSGDTFIGWPAPPPRTLADAIADALLDARAAAAALVELDGTLPDQPLAVALDASGAARTVPADPWLARVSIGGWRSSARLSGNLAETARTLARDWRARSREPEAPTSAIAIVIGDHDPAIARHLHRRTWRDGAGPWLGIGRAGALAVASTCHFVVDGYGHTQIAARIARATDPALRAALVRAAAAELADTPVPPPPPLAGAEPLGVAWRRLASAPRLATLAYSLGLELAAEVPRTESETLSRKGATHLLGPRFGPTMQIPVAPGGREDAERFKRRVRHALVSVRFSDGRPEAEEAFAERLRAAIAREAAGDGLVTRLVTAAARLPVPLAVKRRRVVGARSKMWDAPVEVIAGRAALSVLRLDAPAPPLVAVSAPGRMLAPADPRTSSVITIVADPAGATVACAGTGGSGTHAGADALLDRWVARLPAIDSAPCSAR